MRFFPVLLSLSVSTVLAQNCGPSYGNQVCAAGNCCSQYGWCDVDAAHCDPTSCLPQWSGAGSSCRALLSTTTLQTSTTTTITSKKSSSGSSSKKTSTTTTTVKKTSTSTSTAPTNTFTGAYVSQIPVIDVCGAASSNVSCPGAGFDGYFYRCCSSHGHCGPKNNIQDQSLYCDTVSAGCQPGYGDCETTRPIPPNPTATPGIAQNGDTCGPIVNMMCDVGLCCSGSNFCGNTTDFCGAANWCQSDFGECSG